MNVETFFDPATSTLTHVVLDESTRDAVIVDPVLDYDPASGTASLGSAERVLAYVRGRGLTVHWILETHAHADHLSAAQWLKGRLEARLAVGERIREVQATFRDVFDLSFAADGSQFERLLAPGEVLRAGSLSIEVIGTPGHTPACSTYRIGDALFTGDLLFIEDQGTGRCDFPGGAASDMWSSVQKLYALPDATRVFPGHDYQPGGRELRTWTTIGAEKAGNVQLPAGRSREEFVAMRSARDATLGAPRLLLPSVQINVDAGRLPAPDRKGRRFLRIPLRGPE